MTATFRGGTLQWGIACLCGISLGLYVLGVSWFPQQWSHLFVLAVLCAFIWAIFGSIRRLLVAIIILDIPFQLDFHLFYQDEAAALGALGGLNLSVTTFCLVGLYALWLIELGTRAVSPPRHLFRMSLPLAAYLAFVTLSVVVARDVPLSLFYIALLLQMFLLYVYIVGTVRTRQDVLFIFTVLLISVVLESLVMIGLRFTGQSFQFAGMLARIDPDMRVGGTVGSPINAAGFLCLLIAPAISIFLTQLGKSYKWLATLALILGGIALVLTLSRGGWFSFVLSTTILCLLAWHRGWLSPSLLIIIAIVAGLLFSLLHDTILARVSGDDVGSAYSRLPLMKFAFRIIMDNPLLGIGINNCALVVRQYATGWAWLYAIHNKYLLVWAEAGIGALMAFIWFLLVTIRRGWHCWQLSDRLLAPIALGFTAAIVGQMVHMTVDLFNSRPDVQLLWLIAGLITAMYSIAREGNVNSYGT